MSVQVVAPAAADPGGPPPRFVVRTDRSLCQLEVAADPVLFDATLAARRPPERFHESPQLGVHAGRVEYAPDEAAWRNLRASPFLYYRAAAFEPGLLFFVTYESSVADPLRAPSLRVARPQSGRPRAPSGLSGALTRLHVDRNRVVNAAGDVVVLRGVTVRALETAGGTLTRADVRTIVGDWRANVIRLALDQQRALTNPAYLLAVDAVIRWAAAEGAYTLLAVTRLDDREWGRLPTGAINRTAPLPEENTLRLWSMLAARYRAEPAVLYELFDEPHQPLANDNTYPLRPAPDEAGWIARWHSWARRIADAVRRAAPEALLVVSGWRWGLDLRSFPVPVAAVPLASTVYSTHVHETHPEGLHTAGEADWRSWFSFERLRSAHPIVVGAWGAGAASLAWANQLEDHMRGMHRFVNGTWPGLAGWTHASWSALVDPSGAPTELGELVRGALRTMPAAASADFDAARPRGSRTRDRIAVSDVRRNDFLLVAGHDFRPGSRILVTPFGGSTITLAPRTTLPHLLIVSMLPANVPTGAAVVGVERPDGTITESVVVTVEASPATERAIWAGASKPSPYTLLFLANPAVERRNGTVVRDPIQAARPAFHRAVADAVGYLFGTSERLLLPYAAEIRIMSRFASPAVGLATALVSQHSGGEAWTEDARVAAHLAAIGHAPDHCFVVFRSTTYDRDSASPAIEDAGSAALPHTLDGVAGNHRRASLRPGLTALSTPTDPITALHEYLHGVAGIEDLYVDTAPPGGTINRKRRASSAARRPAAFATLDGRSYKTDRARDGLGYGRWLSYHPELVDPQRPNAMDDYYRADSARRCRLDHLTLRYARDRLEWKLGR